MLKVLLKKQMTEIFRSYFYNAKKNQARSKKATAMYMVWFVLIMGLLGAMFTFLAQTLCAPLAHVEMGWLYFAVMGLMAILLGVFGSVFNTYSGLYLAKDNDLLLSMPIPVSVIMMSRLLSVYLMGLLYSGIVIIPAVLVYWAQGEFSLSSVLGGLLFTLLISVFVMTLSCALGWVVAKISQKLKNKSFITVLVSVAFFGVYYFVAFRAQTLISELITKAQVYGEGIKNSAYPIYLFGKAATGDLLACVLVTAVVAVLFVLMWILISRSFLKLATSAGRTEHKAYRETEAKVKSVPRALLAREFKRFVSSPNYMLNCGLGILILPLFGVAMLWKGAELIGLLGEVFGERGAGSAPLLLCAAVCMAASMNDMAVPSVSLEGKSLWLMQSLPVNPGQVLRSKLLVQLILTGIPVLFCVICFVPLGKLSPLVLLLIALQALSYVLLSALFGLFMGLKMPNLSWTQEITVIKQSMGVMIAMFSGFGYTVLFCAGFLLLSGWKLGFSVYMCCFVGLNLILSAVLYLWLKKRGSILFTQL